MELIIDDNLVGCGVYKITIGEYFYIGASKNLENRVRTHRSKLLKKFDNNPNFSKIQKYAKDKQIKIELLQLCDKYVLLENERNFIKQNKDSKFILNIVKNFANYSKGKNMVSFNIPKELYDNICEISKINNRGISQMVQLLLTKQVDRLNKTKTKRCEY